MRIGFWWEKLFAYWSNNAFSPSHPLFPDIKKVTGFVGDDDVDCGGVVDPLHGSQGHTPTILKHCPVSCSKFKFIHFSEESIVLVLTEALVQGMFTTMLICVNMQYWYVAFNGVQF